MHHQYIHTSSGGEQSEESADGERGSHLDRSSIMSDDSHDHNISSPEQLPERLQSRSSDNQMRSVDSTLRDLQGMLDDDETWN